MTGFERPRSLSYWLVLLFAIALAGCSSSDDDDGGAARVRVLNVSSGYPSLDFYANHENDDSDQLAVGAIARDTVSDYKELDTASYDFKFKRAGISSTLVTLSNQKYDKDSHHLVVAYGLTGHFAALEIHENVSAAGSGDSKVQVLNTANAGGLDIYLTEPSVALDDATPQFTSIDSGEFGAAVTIDSGEYRLRVTGAGATDDLRLDIPSITLDSTEVVTLIFTATEGGMLVDVSLLEQQGSLAKYPNTRARVRAAVGIANGTAVTARVADTTLISGGAVGAISNYAQVDSGSAQVALGVNGAPVPVDNVSLAAGGDYTLLVWSDASGTRTTLVSDDNRLPTTSGKAKIRLLNGLSALAVPANLSVDFSPIAEALAVGAASAYTEIDGGSDYQLDVNDTNTAQLLLTRSSVSMQASGVYTLFVASSNGTVSGTLRKDR